MAAPTVAPPIAPPRPVPPPNREPSVSVGGGLTLVGEVPFGDALKFVTVTRKRITFYF